MSTPKRWPTFKRERDLEDFLINNPEHLGLLIIGRQVRTPFSGRVDLLGIDAEGNLIVIELKLGATRPEVVAQLLEYGHWAAQLALHELIEIASQHRLCTDLPAAFGMYFGHALPDVVNRAQVLTIVAPTYDATTYHSIEALNQGSFTVETLCYVEDRGSIRIAPYRRIADGDKAGSVSDIPLLRSAKLHKSAGGYAAHPDTREFWEIYSPQFACAFVPFCFVWELYLDWCQREAEEGRYRRAHQMGNFGRQLATLVAESDEWAHEVLLPGAWKEQNEPLTRLLPNWKHPDPGKRVFGYLRMKRSDRL